MTATKDEATAIDPAMVDIAKELGAIRAVLMSLESDHAKKTGRALDDADEEASKKMGANKEELGRALALFATLESGREIKSYASWHL